MITETQATIQALAVVETLTNDIDALYVLDQQAKALALQVKELKDAVANKYGDCAKDANGKVIPHKGELHSVTVSIGEVQGSVDYEALCVAYGITKEQLDKFRKESSVRITVTPKK
jgi:hypothetical protein